MRSLTDSRRDHAMTHTRQAACGVESSPGGYMLHALGLAVDQESAYRRLVELPSATASELEPVLDGFGADAARLLAELEALGLASRSMSDSDRYVAVPPQLTLNSLLVARQAELQRAEAEFT